MGGENSGDQPAKEEPNLFLGTLKSCRDTLIPSAKDAVYGGQGDPGSPIASAIQGGGWECTQADNWVAELTAHTKGVMGAFDAAQADVSAAITSERNAHGGKDTVPEHHPHGLAWSRSWHIQQHNL